MGRPKALQVLLSNLGAELDICEESFGVNAFWFAAFFGRGKCLKLLAEAGINVLSKHKDTGANALHVAIERKHHKVVDMLVDSGFPLSTCRF